MSKKSIDDIIKNALENIESNPRQADWDSFESMLDSNELTDFDRYVKSNLDKVSVPADGAWNKFEDKHAEELGHEHPVDEVVKNNLARNEAAFTEKSWLKLSALLDLTDRRERELLIKKVVEVATIAVILFLFIPQFLHKNNQPFDEGAEHYAQQDVRTENNAVPPLEAEKIKAPEHNKASNKDLHLNQSQLVASTQTHEVSNESSNSSLAALSRSQNDASSQTSITVLSPLPATAFKLHLAEFAPSNNNKQLTISTSKLAQLPKGLNHKMPLLQGIWNDEDLRAAQQIPHLAIEKLASNDVPPYPQVELAEMEAPGNLSLGLFTSPQFTHIYTPKDDVYTDPALGIEPFGRVRVFNGMGLEVEKKHNEFSIGGNITYSNLSYRPPAIVEKYDGTISVVTSDTIQNGYRELSLVNLEMQMASISLFLRQYFPLGQDMRLFAHLGSGINMVMKSDYLIHNITNKGNGRRIIEEYNFEEDVEQEMVTATSHVKLREKNFEGGILEGGNFNRNSYMDIELGAGFEYDLNDDCSVYIASVMNLSPFTDGLGPNRDKFNSLNFQFGIKQVL